MKLNLGSVLKRLGGGALTSATAATGLTAATGHLPNTALQVGLAVLPGLIAMIPFGPAPAGLLTPAAPGQAAVLPQLLAGLKALPGMPRAKRNAILVATAEAAGRAAALAAVAEFATRTGQFGPGELAQAAPVPPKADVIVIPPLPAAPAPDSVPAPVAPITVEAAPVVQ